MVTLVIMPQEMMTLEDFIMNIIFRKCLIHLLIALIQLTIISHQLPTNFA